MSGQAGDVVDSGGAAPHQMVFVGGLHRSGTSLLARCLAEHPCVSAFRDTGVPEDEGQFLQQVYPPARAFGGPGRFGFHPGVHLLETANPDPDHTRQRLLASWERYWDPRKPVWLEKSPPNLLRARFLQASFPEAAFLMIMRHPLAVSLATLKWSGTPLTELIEHWLVCHELFDRDRTALGRLLVVRYEDLVARPQTCLDEIHAFLGLENHVCTVEVRSDSNQRYLQTWREHHHGAARGPWETPDIELEHERRIRRFGYRLWDRGSRPGGEP